MIGHELHRSGSFWSFLLSIDRDLADSIRQQGCSCGGRLHCANYPRAPRGRPDHLPEEYRCRFSVCCDRDGCRKRMTPPSVRFLGRKVYLGAVVILISAMRQGPTPRRIRELSTLFGVDRATVAQELRNVPTGSTWCPRNGPCWNGSYRGVRPCAVTGGLETERPRQVVPRSSESVRERNARSMHRDVQPTTPGWR